jgi:acyl-coenzyme A synthetase/AMP-(fatty) acid ligase
LSSELPKATGIVAVNSPAFVRAAFTCLRQGRVFLPLRHVADQERLSQVQVDTVLTPEGDSGWVEERKLEDRSDSLAQVMFTSGTEGSAKAVLLTHRALADVVERLDGVMHLDASIREYVGVPVYHSFGFGRCRAVAAAGGQFFVPARGFNPLEIAGLLAEDRINAISAVPSLWRVLLDSAVITPDLGKRVRFIEIGSQSMSRAEKEQMRALFRNAAIVQHYGLTEASRSTFLEIHEVTGDALESVGRPYGDVEVRLTADGRIAIRGPHVAAGLIVNATARRATDADGWLETNDLGRLSDGYLYYLGRADDIINCGGLKLSPEALETRMRTALSLSENFAICRVADRTRGDGILVAALRSVDIPDAALLDAATNAAQELGVNARGAVHVVRVDALPRTDSGKVQRRQLSEREGTGLDQPAASLRTAGGDDPKAIFSKFVGVRNPPDDGTFTTLGGDSLAFIQTSIALESHLGYLPERWEHLSLAELSRLPRKATSLGQLEPMVWLRALAITVIISNHAHLLGDVSFPGGASLLLVLAGVSFARFQLQRASREDSAWPLLSGLPKLVLPAIALLLVQQGLQRSFSLSPILFFSNFVSPKLGGYWFIEVWIQIYVTLFLLFGALPVSKWARAHPLLTPLGFLALGVAMRVGIPELWNADHLFGRLPHLKFWLFALGWVIARAMPSYRLLASGLVVVLARLLYSEDLVQSLWVGLGGLALIWLPPVRLFAPLAKAVAWVSAASLYIYIAQYLFFRIGALVSPQHPALFGWAGAIVGGGLLRMLADSGFRTLGTVVDRLRPKPTPAG